MFEAKMFGLNQTDVQTDGHEVFGYYVMHDRSNRMTKHSRNIAFYSSTGLNGYVEDDWTRNEINNFTGQHRTYIHNIPYSEATNFQGLIVSAAHNTYIHMLGGVVRGCGAITINESLPAVSLSTKANDKACFSVISDAEEEKDGGHKDGPGFVTVSPKDCGDIRVCINSVGEGAVWVLNTNGPLESGDYIITSGIVPGYGQLQSDDVTVWVVASLLFLQLLAGWACYGSLVSIFSPWRRMPFLCTPTVLHSKAA